MDVRDLPGFEQDRPASQRIKDALLEQRKACNVDELVEITGMKANAVRARLAELVKKGEVVKVIISGAANKWALRAREEMA